MIFFLFNRIVSYDQLGIKSRMEFDLQANQLSYLNSNAYLAWRDIKD